MERSRRERRSSRETRRCASTGELLSQAPSLLEGGNLDVGFIGGRSALQKATLKEMEERDHDKYSDEAGHNWIELHLVVSCYLMLKECAFLGTEKGPVQ